MIFTKDLLFLHVPKTGGMSITKFLLSVLPRPVFYTHPEEETSEAEDGVIRLRGIRHENLEQAREIVAQHGFTLDSFPAILVVLRNPYALEVSRYFYLRAGHPWDFGAEQTLALTRDFVTFVTKGRGGPDIRRYFFLGREIPENLRVIRFEALAAALPAALEDLGISAEGTLSHLNRSRHGAFRDYYNREAEEAVYGRHRWVFDLAFYDRLDARHGEGPATRQPKLMLPIVGPIRQVGSVSGFWPDLWAGPAVHTTLEALHDVGVVEIRGYLPAAASRPVELAALADGTEVGTTRARPGSKIHWTVPFAPRGGSSFDFQVRASRAWRPQEDGRGDDRELAVQLIRLFFRPVEAR